MRAHVLVRIAAALVAGPLVASPIVVAPLLAQQGDTAPPDAPRDSAGAALEVTEAYPGLVQRAAVAPGAAVRAALRKVKNGRLSGTRIEERGKRLVYVVRVEEPRGRSRELLVDASTGRVLSNRKLPRS